MDRLVGLFMIVALAAIAYVGVRSHLHVTHPQSPPSTLVPCNACGESISRAALMCPECGAPGAGTRSAAATYASIVIVGLAILLGIILFR